MGGLKWIFELCIRSFCNMLIIYLRSGLSEECIFLVPEHKIVVIMLLLFKNFYIPFFAS